MPKYLFIATNEWGWGGSEILWSQTAERLARQGNEVCVSIQSVGQPQEPLDRIREGGGKVIHRRRASLATRIGRRLLSLPDYWQEHLRSATAGVDLVIVSQSSYGEVLPWIEAVRATGVTYAVVVQGANTGGWPEDNTAERLAVCFEGAARAFFVSEATLDLCRLQIGTPLDRGVVIRNPFNVRYDVR